MLVMLFVVTILVFETLKNDFGNTYSKIESLWFSNNIGNVALRWVLYFGLMTIILVFNKEVQEFIYFKFSIGQIGRVSAVRCGRHEGPVWAVHVTYRDGRIAVIRCRRETVRAVQ